MAWLQDNGYETPNGAPDVVMANIPHDQARYSHETGKVYVSKYWSGTDFEKGMLLHEIMHHQQEHGECETMEREAYSAMEKFYQEKGLPMYVEFVEIGVTASCDPVNWSKIHRLKKQGLQ